MRRRPFLMIAGLAVAVLAPLTLAYRISASAGEDGGRPWGYVGVSVLLLVLVAALVVGLRDLYRLLGGVDPDATAIAARLGEQPDQRRLVARWLRRSRWYRNVGGVAGVLAGLFMGGLGGMVLVGLIGLTIGSLAAEVHLLRSDRLGGRTRRRPRTAGLERRTLSRYWRPARQLQLAALGLGALVLLAVDGRMSPDLGLRVPWAMATVLTVIGAFAIQWRVATRPRPALPESLRRSDDLVRSLAITNGVANPALCLALAFLGQATAEVSQPLSVGAWLAALGLYWRFRRLGFDWLLAEPPLVSEPAAVAA